MLNCVPFGEKLYEDFVRDRLDLKTISLFATISSKYAPVDPNNQRVQRKAVKELSREAENNKATRYLEYATSRGKTLQYMLEFPITSRPFYLMDKEGKELKKAEQKYELANALLQMLNKDDIVTYAEDDPSKCPHVQSDATIIDFMGVMRRLTAVELTNVVTFGDLCKTFLRNILSYGKMSSEIHVILENYKTISIKFATRKRRQGSVGQLCRIVSDEQPLPEMKDFWNRTENKLS